MMKTESRMTFGTSWRVVLAVVSAAFTFGLAACGNGPQNTADDCQEGEACICPVDSNCTRNCPGGGCQFNCPEDANCTFNCSGGDCTAGCTEKSNCTVNCTGNNCTMNCNGADNCTLSCEESEECTVNCNQAGKCSKR